VYSLGGVLLQNSGEEVVRGFSPPKGILEMSL
jgi:hypothetical protein